MYSRLLSIFLLVFNLAFAQSGTEGVIIYSVTPVEGEGAQAADSKLSNELRYTFKDQKSRLDMSSHAGTFSFIYDNSNSKAVRLTGEEMIEVSEFTLEDIRSFQDCEIIESRLSTEKKDIAGVRCSKMSVECIRPSNESRISMDIWFAESLKLPHKTDLILYGFPAVPMEFDFTYNGVEVHITAKKIEMKSISVDVMKFPPVTSKAVLENPAQIDVKAVEVK